MNHKLAKTCARILIVLAAVVMAGAAIAQQYDADLFKGMRWRLIGPFRGGRVLAVAGVSSQPNTYYFGGVAGGVWKTTDGGLTWSPLTDKWSVSSIGSIAVAESDPNVVYVGTGEACIRGNISHGDGVYKSTDAGTNWKFIGLRDTRHIGRVIVHPKNPDIVFVAALGHVYGSNAERGVFRSTDGGKNWEKVLYKDEKTGAIDIAFAPQNSSILYAALWEANRTPWGMTSGGPGSGLYKSTDGGATWKKLEGSGLPRGVLGRIGVSVSGADSDRVFALIEAGEGGLFRSDNGGTNWRRVNEDRRFRQRAWYYTHVNADPKAVDTVYIMNTGFYRSTDGGRTFTTIGTPHGDNHGLWIDPSDPQRMINGNDGGANVSVNGGRTWTRQDNQPTAQFYHVIADNDWPYRVYGAQQDNSTVGILSRSDSSSIGREDWHPVGGCESGYIAPHPKDSNIVYAGCYGGHITRWDRRTGQAQQVMAWPENPMGQSAGALRHRWQWTAPILFSPHDSNVLYHAAEVLFKTTNGGMSWATISPDLTRNDKSKQGPSGGPITHDNTSVEYYNTIFAVAESPKQKDLIWAGTDDGLVHITRDGGKNWSNVTPKDMPEWSLISLIDASPFEAATAYIAVDRHELDDFKPYIYKTNDFGKSWKRINYGIPENTFVRVVREDPKRRGLLFAGTETGVFVSFDDGANWQALQLNLPTAPIHDLAVKNDDLVVATHGRSFWILDDISPLRQMSAEITAKEMHLFAPTAAIRTRAGGGGGGGGAAAMAGQNPPNGAIFYYNLKKVPEGEVTIEILDAKGSIVREFSSRAPEAPEGLQPGAGPFGPQAAPRVPKEKGLNRFVWNLRYEDASRVQPLILWASNVQGPLAVPGAYQVKFTAGGTSQTAPLEVKLDSRVQTSPADLQKQFGLLMQIRAKVTETHDAINQLRDVRTQIQALRRRHADNAKAKDLLAQAEALEKKLDPIEEPLIQRKASSGQDLLNWPIMLNNKLTALAGIVESADTAPTEQSYEVFKYLAGQVDPLLAKWRQVREKDVASLNAAASKMELPAVQMSTPKP
jgi:photosystem II stability/assembly factor-like uncharacterized protein